MISLVNVLLIIIVLNSTAIFSQNILSFSYSFGANATISRLIKSENMTWGYYNTLIPNTWDNSINVSYGSEKHKVDFSLENGSLGPTWEINAYPNKYPYSDAVDLGDSVVNWSRQTHIQGRYRKNTDLLKFNFLWKYAFLNSQRIVHNSILGFGLMKTRVEEGNANFGTSFYANDTIGWMHSGFIMDRYEYFRNKNFYFILGYEALVSLNQKIDLKFDLLFNQGLYRMIRWHTYRFYYESSTFNGPPIEPQEYDHQWSVSRLSYLSATIGLSYKIQLNKN